MLQYGSTGTHSGPHAPADSRTFKKAAVIATKLIVTGLCFWYLSWQVELSAVFKALRQLELRWAAASVAVVILQLPLVAMRWREILKVLVVLGRTMTNMAFLAMTAIGFFFTQVLPALVGDGMRAWLLVRRGCDWRNALTSVAIDRAVGIGLVVALGFVILLMPSSAVALGEARPVVLMAYGALLVTGLFALLLLPKLVPLLGRWRFLRWMAALAVDIRRVFLGPKIAAILSLGVLVHALTMAVIWSVARAQGLALSASDVAVLFVVMVGVALVPISINGWGLREIAVVAVLGSHGIAPEQALVFSICFGLVLAVGSLPGALAWLLYSSPPANESAP
jgi:uncharacterized membrane protein YbhN (UPF0104 family)